MDELEVFGLLVACLCHDLDHRGTNNSYQTKVRAGRGQEGGKQGASRRQGVGASRGQAGAGGRMQGYWLLWP